MQQKDVEHLHQLVNVANQYISDISEYEDIYALLENPILTKVPLLNLITDIQNKWKVPVDYPNEAVQAKISADIFLFDIAIGNLIDNAQKFGVTQSSVRISIKIDKELVHFDVIDDGGGIPLSEAKAAFQQFYRINIRHHTSVRGSGLGLFIALGVAQAHKGDCRVHAQNPSTLRLSFPVAIAQETSYE